MWRERAFCTLQVIKRYAQNHRVAHDIKPDSNERHGVPFDEHTPNSDAAWYFHDLACLRYGHWLCEDYAGRGNGQYSLGHQDGGETAE